MHYCKGVTPYIPAQGRVWLAILHQFNSFLILSSRLLFNSLLFPLSSERNPDSPYYLPEDWAEIQIPNLQRMQRMGSIGDNTVHLAEQITVVHVVYRRRTKQSQ